MKRVPLAAAALLAVGCTAPPFPVVEMVQEWADYMNQDHSLVPGDALTITAFQMPELTQEVVVSPQGTVSLKRLAEPVRAVDVKMSQFRAAVQRAYLEIVPTVEISVNLKTPNIKSVYVGGRVRQPAAVPWHSNLTISQAIAAAGSFLLSAKPSDVLVVRPRPGGQNSMSAPPGGAVAPATAARMIRVNVEAILYGDEPDLPLLPGDVVWCQRSPIGAVGDWVELYIRRLLPINPGAVSLTPL